MDTFAEEFEKNRCIIERALEKYLRPRIPSYLWKSMAYSTVGGGKRIRGVLVIATAEALGTSAEKVIPAACAVECIHAQSLIHDDLPCMDNDTWRRGKPSNHVVFGEATATVAGDALLAYAFEIMAQAGLSGNQPSQWLRVIKELAEATGGSGMCGGQSMDLMSETQTNLTQKEVTHIHQLKTGCLIRAAVRMGAILGDADMTILNALTAYAENLGQAFQVIDDILDQTATFDLLGKTPGKDMVYQKWTYLRLFDLDTAQKLAENLIQKALKNLLPLGEKALFFKQIAHYFLERQR